MNVDIFSINKIYFTVELSGLVLDIKPPTLKIYDDLITAFEVLKQCNSKELLAEIFSAILSLNRQGIKIDSKNIKENKITDDEMNACIYDYFRWMVDIQNQPQLKIPYCPTNDEKGHFDINTFNYKIVSDYTKYDFDKIYDLSVFEYWLYLHDASIHMYSQTESGRQYLEDCWRMEQTAPDKTGLRNKFGKPLEIK